MKSRRDFLRLLGIGATIIAADPEALLWTPGKKLISIPSIPKEFTIKLVISNQQPFYDTLAHGCIINVLQSFVYPPYFRGIQDTSPYPTDGT